MRVKTPFVELDFHGPFRAPKGSVGVDSGNTAHFDVRTIARPIEVTWVDSAGLLHEWTQGQNGPRFFEDTTYRVRAKSLSGNHVPVLAHRDPYLLQEIDTYREDRMCVGPINFRRQVGRSELEIRVGHETLWVKIEVFPVKLDYAQDYQRLLSDVASAARGLALEYLRATFRSGSAADYEDTTDLEWVTLLQSEIDGLKKSIRYINDHPQRLLSRRSENVSIERLKRVDSSVRRAVIRRLGSGKFIRIPSTSHVRENIPAIRNQETLDTPEHRWLRLNLSLIGEHLAELHVSVVAEIGKYEATNRRIPKRLQAEERELARSVRVLEELQSLRIFEGIEVAPPPGFTSLSLVGGVGYGTAYRAITVLRLGLDIEGDCIDFSVRDVHDLYEVWCFLELVRLVTSLVGGKTDTASLVQIEESGIRVRLRRGAHSIISFSGVPGGRKILLSYNPAFPGLTGDQRPDVLLCLQQLGWPDLVVVFDAKYRLDASDDYKRRFGTVGPPQDAVNVIHRYRDAIVVGSAERELERPVVKGAALFPLSADESRDFYASPLFEALNTLGVGALPFLPSNTGFVHDWLKVVLSMTPESLAEPGPPFAGLAEKHRRALALDS